MALTRLIIPLLVFVAVGCVRNPATGQRQLSLVSRAQEVEIGRQARQEVVETVGLVRDPELQSYVSTVGMRLVEQAGLSEAYPFSFQVVDDAAINAFALPGGPIFVTRGILAFLGSEAELAALLGHEIAHVAARHGAIQLTRAQLAQFGLGLGAVLLGREREALANLAGAGLQLALLGSTREAERQADELGLDYLVTSRYEPEAMPALFLMLSRVPETTNRGRLPGWLQTHPDPEERLRVALKRVEALPPIEGVLDREQYLLALDGLPYGATPNAGFFRGQTFVHPQLGFSFTFPEGFETRNLPQAVVGVAEGDEAALILGLTTAGAQTPRAAAQRFADQPGLAVRDLAPRTISGQPGLTASFVAQTEIGPVEGVVSFVRLGDRVYQLIGYAPRGRLQRYLPALQDAFETFGAVSPADVAAAQPYRIEITRVPEPMTLIQFHERFPSVVPLEEIARLNGLEPPSALEAGRLMKRVVDTPGS